MTQTVRALLAIVGSSQEKALNAVVSRGSTADATADERQARECNQRRFKVTRGPFDVGCLLTFRCGEAQGLRLGSGHLAEEAYASGRSRGSIQREGQD